MTNKYKYFIANWKMFGNLNSINSINKVIKLSNLRKFKKAKIIYCPPYTLISNFFQKIKKTNIDLGGQNCHHSVNYGPHTGFVNSKMIKDMGCKYVIVGHSENRSSGDTNDVINKKIKASISNKLKIIFCIGENIIEKKSNKTKKVLHKQISQGLKNVSNIKNVIFAYEPIWSIGTGKIPSANDLIDNIIYIKKILKKKYKLNNSIILYGGSVNSNNIKNLRKIDQIDGFLIGGASQKANIFIDIIKKTFN